MKYTSTRDASVSVSAADAVIDGISSDGGLYVPSEIPELDFKSLVDMDYASRVDAVLSAFFDFDVEGVAESAYATFQTDDPAPIVKLDDRLFMLELWHGRTHAFKDMALSVLPRLLQAAKKSTGRTETTLILVATSGDTGKAALEGFKDVEGTKVVVFYPTDGVSEVQKLAMQTQTGDNVFAVGINGNFDDAQTAVKIALRDEELIKKLAAKNIRLSSANSINIGRLVPQIAYYFSAYCDLFGSGELKKGETVDFAVPTGNFGNILAGWYAKKMGVPVNRLVCASNRNNVLTDFITTGNYDINRKFYKTTSPSMDILISSNLERLLFEVSGRNAEKVKDYMQSLSKIGSYHVSSEELEAIREVFSAGYADEKATSSAIDDMFEEYGYLIDTHTAAAYDVARLRDFTHDTVVVSTANPFKFAPAVLEALGEKTEGEVTPDTLKALSELTAMEAPESLMNVFSLPVRFGETIEKTDIIAYIADKFGNN